MKNNFHFITLILLCLSSVLTAQTTLIPDDNFENYLETHAADGSIVDIGDANSMGDGVADNDLVLTDRISNVTTLDLIDLAIADLTGINDFTNLEILVCSNNRLPNIDVSANTNLKLLNVSNNRITGELVVGNNVNLEGLFCSSNQINILDLSENTVLKNLDASNNLLTNLDLSLVNSLICPDPQTNPITLCQGSASINVSRNQLNSLLVNNGYNDLISLFDASENPDLFCIQIDAGFTPNGWVKDDWTYYSENTCVDIYTYVPDDNFEQALIDQGYDDTLDNLVLTDNIDDIINLDVSNLSISSFIGIEDFLMLEILDCSNNTINNINLTTTIALQELNIENNSLVGLDLTANTALSVLNCADNLLSNLDISANNALTILNCSNNNLNNLNLSSNDIITSLDCSGNQIESLDLTPTINLTNVLCNNNNLFSLDLSNGNNAAILTLDASNNNILFCIKVDDVAFANTAANWQKDAMATYNLDCGTYVPDDNFEQALIDQGIDTDGTLNNFVPTADVIGVIILDVSSLAISDLTGIEDFIALEDLNISNNEISSLDVTNNTALVTLDCSINQIENLDLTANLALTSVLCSNNSLKTLNIENGNNAALAVFNSMQNPNLFCINVDDAIVGNIPMSWQKDDFAMYNGDCQNNRFTAIPDPFFEQALINLGYDAIIDGQVLTSNIEHVQSLDISNESISDLTGIQDFQSLVELDCSSNFLDALDVSGMVFLERLSCSSNYLLTNDINDADGLFNTAGTVSLTELFCSGNSLNNLDISQNPNIEILDCSDNDLSELIINANTALRILNCSNNLLTTLDISNSNNLEDVNCDTNQINNLITSGIVNTSLVNLSCATNDLSDLSVNNYQGLIALNCASNALTQLVIDNINTLETLDFTSNQVSNITLTNNTNLIEILAAQNELSQLIVTSNSLLKTLNCDFNDITQLDVNSNPLLEFLSGSNNQLTELDITNNDNLIEANFSSNLIVNITLANNLESLKRLNLSNNQIDGDIDLTTMAISACTFQPNQTEFCPETIAINLSNNLFDFINIQNGINNDIVDFNATGNLNLECIQVDDANTVGLNWLKDDATSYNEDCNFGETFVPDDNFEQALIDLGYDSAPLNDYVLTANIQDIMSLDISGNGIENLIGIEDFVALETLNMSNNNIVEVDLSSNINLINLDCSANQLTQLQVSNNTLLEVLNCSNNMISSLDLNNNENLTDLNFSTNNFTSFIPSDVPSLIVFNADDNLLTDLDFQQNLNLTSLSCQLNLLETLNIKNGQNAILLNLNASNNPDLLCIETDTGTIPAGATWTIDTTAQIAVECFFGQTFVPDDNFESALIDLGYDSGPLDDYVPTENIESVTFLNINGREIEDLTGIEDFVNLISLNFEDNGITSVDLSANSLLTSLNASGNLLTDLDISNLIDLTTLKVPDNSLDQIDLNNNLNIMDLDVSNNQLTALDVNLLVDLEELNCASNQISNLDVTQNPNLVLLFCQSNTLIADQLNLQNGNNENLLLFNATNNQNLACILVDNPVVVIENTDGTFDNWFKDESASYQIVCEDADNDGVPNTDDQCPNTPFGAAVDLFGCAILDLPHDNFAITITGETCLNSNNGKITIVAQELYNYTVSLFSEAIIEPTGEDFYQEYNFTNDVDIFNLLAATYEMCITIEEWPDYQSCYTVVITEPNPLEVFSSLVDNNNVVSLDMTGSTSYNVELNGDMFTTYNSNINLALQTGVNTLKVSTDIECQGTYEEKFVTGIEALVHPNPFKDEIRIFTGKKEVEFIVNIYTLFGQLVMQKSYIDNGNTESLDTSMLASGMYIIAIQSNSEVMTYKIIKE